METEKNVLLTQKARDYKPPPKKRALTQKDPMNSEIQGGPLSQIMQMNESGSRPKNAELMMICACGNRAELKGYCMNCIDKLKKKHNYLVNKFEELNKEYDKYKPDDPHK